MLVFLWVLQVGAFPPGDHCAFTSEEEFAHCCCDPETFCWGFIDTWQRDDCCKHMEDRCPRDSKLVRRHSQRWRRDPSGPNGTARYRHGESTWTLEQLLNCDHLPPWKQFRQQLQTHGTKLRKVAQDPWLLEFARSALRDHNLSVGEGMFSVASVVHLRVISRLGFLEVLPAPEEIFCFSGYVSAAFVLAMATQDRQLVRHAANLFTEVNTLELDTSSSSAWPVSVWDLLLNLGRSHRVAPWATYAPPPSASVVLAPLEAPGPWRKEHREATWTQPIKAMTLVDHPALDVEIVSFLMSLFPMHVTFAFLDKRSSYTGSTMADHICREWPQWCAWPHRAITITAGDPSDPRWRQGPAVDLHLCSWYVYCDTLEKWTQRRMPLISYYGGHPLNSFPVRDGHTTVEEELRPMWDYLDRRTSALLLCDAAYTREALHSWTGQLLPSYRPLATYIPWKYAPKARSLLLPKTSSAGRVGATEWMLGLLASVAGVETLSATSPATPSFHTLFMVQRGFLSFETLAGFSAVAYLPGPHSWVVSQWREFYNMGLPLLVPHREDLMSHSRYWFERLWHNLQHVPEEKWMPSRAHWAKRHPFSPWMPLKTWSSQYAQATMYWSQFLEFFTWPHVQFFRGVPDLVRKARTLDFPAISRAMSAWTLQGVAEAESFWRAVPGPKSRPKIQAVPGSLCCFRLAKQKIGIR
ncbi:unnamed protein product [Effrenium voratum]|uniref:Uncharacterized protein n=2 Tax=Effrenium voratum TaxID=2562239 RepID=A0AA36HNY6_9DINO|nr:unnamed protein product [Effrenium voratum]